MYLDLCHYLGLLHWICCIQISEMGRDFICDKKLSRYFIKSLNTPDREHAGMILVVTETMKQTNQGNRVDVSQNDGQFLKLLLSRNLSRRRRAIPGPANATESSVPQSHNNRNGATAYAFGNPSLPKKSRRKKPPNPKPPG